MTAPALVGTSRYGRPPVVGGAAWEAAWDALAAGPRFRPDLVAVMQRAGMAAASAEDLLRTAVGRGFLVVVERDAQGRPTLARRAEGR